MFSKLKFIWFIVKKISNSTKRVGFINFVRISAIMSVALGSMALIISLSILEGFDETLKEYAVKFKAHISLVSINGKLINDYKTKSTELQNKFPNIKEIYSINEREGLIKSKSYTDGILIRGIDDNIKLSIYDNIIKGEKSFNSRNNYDIIIGNKLAEKLSVTIGDSIILFAMKANQSINNLAFPNINKFKIIGIYETGMVQYDDIYVYIPFNTSFKLFDIPNNSITNFDISLTNINDSKLTANAIEDFLGLPFICFTVFELHSSIFAWIDLQKQPIPIVLGLIGLVAILNIMTILLIIAIDKTHTIGILRTIGFSNKGIISVFILQGIIIGFSGTIIGCSISYLFCFLQENYHLIRLKGDIYVLDVLPVSIKLWHYNIVIIATLILSFLASMIPSYVAVKITPVKAIRYK